MGITRNLDEGSCLKYNIKHSRHSRGLLVWLHPAEGWVFRQWVHACLYSFVLVK